MNKYGTIFEPNFNLNKDKFRALIVEYYQNPRLQKVKDTKTQSVYMAMVSNQLLAKKQYIVVTCTKDKYPIGKISYLVYLQWNSFQTRYLENSSTIIMSYIIPSLSKFDIKLQLIERQEEISRYKTLGDFSVYVSLLHDNKNLYEYPNLGTLISALETFKTIITFN